MQQMPAAQSISPASQVSSVTDTLRNTSPDTEVVRGTPYPGNAETTLELQSMSYQDPTSLPVIVVANQTGGSIGVQAIHTSSTPSDLLLLMSSATTILPVIVVAKQPGVSTSAEVVPTYTTTSTFGSAVSSAASARPVTLLPLLYILFSSMSLALGCIVV